ncbi:low molecular weight protein-tyrosine-phosphatase [Porphyromonas levii]|uniref:low molecular weight protein-tyrosine-phosphatase n=1 Tax=Porphyromonas levii TaxID=28114 RepID=UPI001BABCB69|nr:low molecular weight protein-tyrosine-phosphatase [Porphyromonas levii]MBR8763398.1 putative low molecular weight protein-tyrosine-phosphatase [Porphyromonas levii]MBR8765288.1 putative low molecular weight protein-tyrosine-phosphatase [Porphyromonas levii]MBR8784939.1 putative low molecular weight protein-tyrosine-phosphatase [Porphyromonas levii]MBR8802597.1 putative low molecular weight protein-tyrosine-phosphatase [Porphyromonas levii]MBR8806489.1 putative low molecular weight protein-t
MKKTKILFVCLGNICRSPSAEGIALHIIKERGWEDYFEIDSAGLHRMHAGELPDPRTRRAAQERGYDLTSRSREIETEDFYTFDLIVAMDDANATELYHRAPGLEESRKIVKMREYFPEGEMLDYVPDPYYGGARGFELVLDLLEASVENLLRQQLQK